jgi:hypothetical protein
MWDGFVAFPLDAPAVPTLLWSLLFLHLGHPPKAEIAIALIVYVKWPSHLDSTTSRNEGRSIG